MLNHNKKGITILEIFIIITIIVILIKMAEPQHGWNGGIRARNHREKDCFYNIRILTGAVESYNIESKNEEKMMKTINQDLLLGKYIKDKIICPETSKSYLSEGDLTVNGYIYCDYHGEPTQKLRKSKRFSN